ncbi:helix-turn-helix transcriptional regulator [Arthrobacter sp. TMN-49]
MKSQRLLSMMLLLQIHHQMTAVELAEELGVSVRTVLRDVVALADAGVPVFAERGRYGGIVLLPGSQLDVSKLSPTDVETLKLLGLDPEQRRQLGVESLMLSAQRKLASRQALRPRPQLPLSQLVVVDNTPWFSPVQGAAGVAELARALQPGKRLRIHYRRSAEGASSWNTVDPYGLLAKAGRWYLVADASGVPRLYLLQRLERWEVLPEDRLLRPEATLASVSRELSTTVQSRGVVRITATLSKDRLDLAQRILGSRLASSKPLGPDTVEITVIYDQIEAVRQLLQFGVHLHVTGPAEAQAIMRDVATDTAALYGR